MRNIIIIIALFALIGCKTTYTLVEYDLMSGQQKELTLPTKKGDRLSKRIIKSTGVKPEQYSIKDSLIIVIEPEYYELKFPYLLVFKRRCIWNSINDLK